MKTKVGALNALYILISIYFCYRVFHAFQVGNILSQTKTIDQATDLLNLRTYRVFDIASQIMADGRSIQSVLFIIINSISLPKVIIGIGVLYLYLDTQRFWEVSFMMILPYLLYLIVLVPIVYGFLTQRINSTFISVNYMAQVLMAVSLLLIVTYGIKVTYLMVVSLKK